MGNQPPKLSKVAFHKTGTDFYTVYHPVVNGKIYHNDDYIFDMVEAKVDGKNVEITTNPCNIKTLCFDDKETASQFLKALHYCVTRENKDGWTFIDGKMLLYNHIDELE